VVPNIQHIVEGEVDPLVRGVLVMKSKHIVDSLSFETTCLFLLLVCFVYLVVAKLNTNICGNNGMIDYVNNVMKNFICLAYFVTMSQNFSI